ncbi:hypothetical protein F4778DRAFT_762304 [Xylariomycetidae sp. FL2044]|nr:hypothetical protein F4778DRAFT_762304 [Xylariomycetidae sp. FL2044]
MAPVTEFCSFKLKPDVDPMALFNELARTPAEQPGNQGVRGSRVHEDAGALRVFMDWESLEAHRAFQAREDAYRPFLAKLAGVFASPPSFFHAALSPHPPAVLDNAEGRGESGVAELIQLYFGPADQDQDQVSAEEATSRGVQAFIDALAGARPEGFSGQSAAGWAIEELEYGGEMCRCFVVCLGWDSVDAHMRFRDTEAFQKVIPLLRGLAGMKGVQVCHVSNRVYGKDT